MVNPAFYLYTCSAEQSESTGDGYNVTVVLCFHLRQEGLCHLLGGLTQIILVLFNRNREDGLIILPAHMDVVYFTSISETFYGMRIR